MWFPKHRTPPPLREDEDGFYVAADNRPYMKVRLDKEDHETHFKFGFFIINVFDNNVQFRMLCWRRSKLAAEMLCHTDQIIYRNKNPLDLRRSNLSVGL